MKYSSDLFSSTFLLYSLLCGLMMSILLNAFSTSSFAVCVRNHLHQCAYRIHLMNEKVSLETLELRRVKSDLILMYKLFHDLVDIPIERFFVRLQSDHNVRTQHQFIIQFFVRSKCLVIQDSYFNRVVNVNLVIELLRYGSAKIGG
jgi:hypothetical protein